ncbi:hypothetical protein D3C72_1232540 [compost metagenome]
MPSRSVADLCSRKATRTQMPLNDFTLLGVVMQFQRIANDQGFANVPQALEATHFDQAQNELKLIGLRSIG